MGRTKHDKGYWKGFFDTFRYGLSCEVEDGAKKIFWKYHQKGSIKRSKFRISIELNSKVVQGYLYYKDLTEEQAWMEWLKKNCEDTYRAILEIQEHKICLQYDLEKNYPELVTHILTIFGNHNFLVNRHFICSGKPVIYADVSVSKEEIDKYIEDELPKFIYGKKSDEVKRGYRYQTSIFEILKTRLQESHYEIMSMEKEKYFKVDGHAVRFDIFGIIRSPAFNTPMFFVVEVKNYVLSFKHLSHLLLFDYKAKKVFGNQPVLKYVISRGCNPLELFKRAYELGINIMTAYDRKGTSETVVYPKRRVVT
jgi:hypothetical protein